ncbi:hypothetical protein M3210_00415 [Oceanobacillus luteolus]|uniref:DUF4190 domain-containing protein n=1 Tax=Oceanobacillus luteolus TaxID=1274358 RepID=A0ABW4HWH8_9BACI|nr:hypothetical protein [Oceanobacillus luteolus]MCM3738722.1 hypothetical protein [Oceanobacillus luteolus]
MDENKRSSDIQPAPHRGEDNDKRRYDEEYAAEIVGRDVGVNKGTETISTYGWIGIVLSFLSFLIWPLLLAVAGIVLGFMSRSKGADTLGNIAIGIGVLSIILRLFI